MLRLDLSCALQVEQHAGWFVHWLPHVRLTVLKPDDSTPYDPCAPFKAYYASLRHLASPKDTVHVPDQDMTHEAMEALRGLPEWNGVLDMSGCR